MTSLIQKVDVPEGSSGDWRVERFEIDDHASKMSAIKYGGRAIPVGTYTGLWCGSGLFESMVMSDTPAEMRDHFSAVARARNDVLINGLGLGMVVQACLDKPEVTHVTVVEISPDVIALVGPHYQNRYGDRLRIVQADAFSYSPERPRYGMVWHDIWANPHRSVLPEMTRLKRKYGRRADWQGCWAEALVKSGRI